MDLRGKTLTALGRSAEGLVFDQAIRGWCRGLLAGCRLRAKARKAHRSITPKYGDAPRQD
jgi:hypothetical protein